MYWLLLGSWIALIYFFGSAYFGRNQTQNWIDRLVRHPRLCAWLNAQHGHLRASWHYVEFSALFFLIYFGINGQSLAYRFFPALASWASTMVAAVADEWRQYHTGGRQFRRIDLLHSFLGATLALSALALLG
ncbi:MAG: VanZ family protein [bacterium]